MRRGPVIAIDGPSGVGKTTVSKRIAVKLGFAYIDTGAMYRAFALGAKESGIDMEDEEKLKRFAEEAVIRFERNGEEIFFNGKDYTKDIRSEEAGKLASLASTKKIVREKLVSLQQKFAEKGSVVMEGRDIGTVVFPEAEVKIFLDASSPERVRRRHKERGTDDIGTVKREISDRDFRDSTRTLSPLKKAKDAVCVDTTTLTIEEVGDKILNIIKEKTKVGDIDR